MRKYLVAAVIAIAVIVTIVGYNQHREPIVYHGMTCSQIVSLPMFGTFGEPNSPSFANIPQAIQQRCVNQVDRGITH